MTLAKRKQAGLDVDTEVRARMTEYGITRVPVDYYHFREFRYSNLDDAIAQAQRQRSES